MWYSVHTCMYVYACTWHQAICTCDTWCACTCISACVYKHMSISPGVHRRGIPVYAVHVRYAVGILAICVCDPCCVCMYTVLHSVFIYATSVRDVEGIGVFCASAAFVCACISVVRSVCMHACGCQLRMNVVRLCVQACVPVYMGCLAGA